MVTFLHSDPGTPSSVWTAAVAAHQMPSIDLRLIERLVVVAAHPDDETLGAGGLLALATDAGIDIDVIVATNGEHSHPDSPTHTPHDLSRIRQVEVRRAIRRVAPNARVHLLHLPDGGLANHIPALIDEIGCHLSGGRTEHTVVVSTWIADGHPDHHAVGIAARDAGLASRTRVLQYPIWGWHWSSPSDGTVPLDRMLQVALPGSARDAKRRALGEYRSQLEPLSTAPGDESVLPANFLEHFDRDCEVFLIPDHNGDHADVTAAGEPPFAPSLTKDFFDEFYADRTDPWGFETRWYEERKRDLTLASLPRRRFRSAFEPGCSIGVLTAALAQRCEHVLAADISTQPLKLASQRLSQVKNVELRQLQVPHQWPAEKFDLVVLSEIGYYCDSADLDLLIERATESLTDDGVLVACHWRHPVAEYPLGGDEVHARLRAHPQLTLLAEHTEADFRLDVLVPPPGWSVGVAQGLS